MPQLRFNHVFVGMMGAGLAGALIIPPSITDRARGKEELLLYPVIKPVRGIAWWFHGHYGEEKLPPGETRRRTDSEFAVENAQLRQQVAFLTDQLQALTLVEAERKRLGGLLDYFKPVPVLGGDGTPNRESLAILPAAGVSLEADTPVMCSEGLVGKLVEGRRVRLITDKDFTNIGQFGRYENGKWLSLGTPKASVKGAGNGALRVEHLTMKEAGQLAPGDWVILSDASWPQIVQGRPLGQVELVRPLAAKPVYAEIIIRPRTELKRLKEVLVLRKR